MGEWVFLWLKQHVRNLSWFASCAGFSYLHRCICFFVPPLNRQWWHLPRAFQGWAATETVYPIFSVVRGQQILVCHIMFGVPPKSCGYRLLYLCGNKQMFFGSLVWFPSSTSLRNSTLLQGPGTPLYHPNLTEEFYKLSFNWTKETERRS